MEPQFTEKAALIKYHATMMRRQLVRDLCVVYENIFDLAAERECKSIALPGAASIIQNRSLHLQLNCKVRNLSWIRVRSTVTCDRNIYRQSWLSEHHCSCGCYGCCATADCRRYLP